MNKKICLNYSGLLMMLLLSTFLVACAGHGTSNLSRSTVDAFQEGKTTKDEIASVLGHPRQMMDLDKKGLDDYMYRVFLKKPAPDEFQEDKYEVWTYDSYSVVSPVPLVTIKTQKNSIFVLSSNGVLVRKFYSEK